MIFYSFNDLLYQKIIGKKMFPFDSVYMLVNYGELFAVHINILLFPAQTIPANILTTDTTGQQNVVYTTTYPPQVVSLICFTEVNVKHAPSKVF